MSTILETIIQFQTARNWRGYHTPRNLACSIMIEAAELLENYQWGDEGADMENVKEELADILIYAYTLAHELNLDIETIMRDKIAKNAIKYPEPH
ncbi:MAG: nucleotide pyrophosphohydrolase [Aerococcaceae bacterium]|nr:nucleotide pyrophosphohydrolase [Aerococcaceae bacterium]